ncbi:Uncharacterized protein TCM_004831 [Theobroma cacao]|uniref:Uncharacterized protein n=1 Tax=Theobroma cacao TaxID=3641 RepID=A0A061DR71_THECC|nr:Uncharacterized protein TCM_004831 [Theobroma cacao]
MLVIRSGGQLPNQGSSMPQIPFILFNINYQRLWKIGTAYSSVVPFLSKTVAEFCSILALLGQLATAMKNLL